MIPAIKILIFSPLAKQVAKQVVLPVTVTLVKSSAAAAVKSLQDWDNKPAKRK
jgi:hypothetical protein